MKKQLLLFSLLITFFSPMCAADPANNESNQLYLSGLQIRKDYYVSKYDSVISGYNDGFYYVRSSENKYKINRRLMKDIKDELNYSST